MKKELKRIKGNKITIKKGEKTYLNGFIFGWPTNLQQLVICLEISINIVHFDLTHQILLSLNGEWS